MIIKAKYKIARRLGPAVFEKTLGQKFALRQGRKQTKWKRPSSEFGTQLLEKQKARYTYGINERQFAKYVAESIADKKKRTDENLFEKLEKRLDNVAFRIGFAPTRQASRQMVSHGHLLVNGKRITIPSFGVKIGDKIKVRDASLKKVLFTNLEEKMADRQIPNWLKLDIQKKEAIVQGLPKLVKSEAQFNIESILEFYKR